MTCAQFARVNLITARDVHEGGECGFVVDPDAQWGKFCDSETQCDSQGGPGTCQPRVDVKEYGDVCSGHHECESVVEDGELTGLFCGAYDYGPNTGTTRVCRYWSPVSGPCEEESDCIGSDSAGESVSCDSGQCTTSKLAGAQCTAQSTCALGQYCSDGEDGVCTRYAALGEVCDSSDQCVPGAECHQYVDDGSSTGEQGDGDSTPSVCVARRSLPDGSIVGNAELCLSGLVDARADGSHTCLPLTATNLYGPGASRSPCLRGNDCISGVCECTGSYEGLCSPTALPDHSHAFAAFFLCAATAGAGCTRDGAASYEGGLLRGSCMQDACFLQARAAWCADHSFDSDIDVGLRVPVAPYCAACRVAGCSLSAVVAGAAAVAGVIRRRE